MNRGKLTAIAVSLLTVAGVAALYWYQQQGRQPAPAPRAEAPPVAEPAAPASAPSVGVRHPLDPALAASAAPVAALGEADAWRQALGELTSPAAVLRFFRTDDFARRVVVTVDNLARAHAAPAMWPLNPTPGRYSVSGSGDERVVAPTNAARYAPLVATLVAVDSRRAAALYARLYPQLQKAYEAAGYPGRYFNDRVVEVIDHLLTTPDADEPVAITLTEVKGELPSAQPWLRYEFADPALQGLSAGQKLLLRVGPEHRRALKQKIGELRTLITRSPPSR